MRYSSISAVALASAASAALYSDCSVTNSYCLQIGLPETTISSNSGNLYIQLQASTSYSWVALGQGSSMAGSNMFIMYTDGTGNVTVSTRSSTGHTQPQAQTDTKISLLEGSGVSGDVMTANFVCENCDSWSGGSMQLGNSATDWITAWKKGSSLDSTSQTVSISIHDEVKSHKVDLSSASISSDANPFVASRGTLSSTSSATNASSSTGNTSSASSSGSDKSGPDLVKTHGYIMAAMFVLLFPIGSILMPALQKWALHGILQIIAIIGMWIGFGFGHRAADKAGVLFDDSHQIIGTVVCAAMMLQPFIGYAHHRYFVRNKCRGMVSYLHIWYGRLLLGLGVVNGGLGLNMANASDGAIVAYAVLAGIWGVVYGGISSLNELKRDRAMRKMSDEKDLPIETLRSDRSADYEHNNEQPPSV